MRQTSQFGHPLPEGLFISSVIIDHQMATPRLKEVSRMGSAPTGLVIEHHNPRRPFQVVAPIRPHISPFGLSLSGIKLLHRCFVGMQDLALS